MTCKRLEIGQIYKKDSYVNGKEIGQILTIIEAEVCPDHIHMLVEIPKYSVSSFMGF